MPITRGIAGLPGRLLKAILTPRETSKESYSSPVRETAPEPPEPRIVKLYRGSSGLRRLTVSGSLLLLGYVARFVLLESPTMWVHPALVQELWPQVFGPLLNLFPREWTGASRTSQL